MSDQFLTSARGPTSKKQQFPIDTTIEIITKRTTPVPRYNYQSANWDEFNKTLKCKLQSTIQNKEPGRKQEFHCSLRALTEAIIDTADKLVPKTRPLLYIKRW